MPQKNPIHSLGGHKYSQVTKEQLSKSECTPFKLSLPTPVYQESTPFGICSVNLQPAPEARQVKPVWQLVTVMR